MAWIVLAAVVALPVIEIALFVKSAQWVGLLPTIVLVIGAGMIGLTLIRRQGLDLALRARAQIDRGEVPVQEALDGICLALAGGLLLLPGFFSDIMAVLLLLPPVRALIRLWLLRYAAVRTAGVPPHQGPQVIEAEYTVVEDRDPSDRRPGS
jgi:Protein affecting phage T7 exclusion by the F plasmid